MYVELHNYQELDQKVLFFKLKTSLNLDSIDGVDRKVAGVYAIYKDDLCLYVGQSTNIASRLATHIKGKYQEFTKIYVLDIENIGWCDFKDRNKKTQDNILLSVEKYVMSILNPIENINIDHDYKTSEEMTPDAEVRKDYIQYDFILHKGIDYSCDTLVIQNQDGVFDYFKELIRIDVDHLRQSILERNRTVSGILSLIDDIQEKAS